MRKKLIMINKIKLIKLILVGFRKSYSVTFKPGLNYISGPTSTGKSTIVEMINYCFGSKEHKDYIEVGQSCSDVELDFEIGDKRYKIRRPLFEFNRPAKLFSWDNNIGDFENDFKLLDIDTPANEDSLSAFMLREIGLYNIKVANQEFSFRDLFKYCYIKQTEIDSENLLKEKLYGYSIKRKPTFEIIFNIHDAILAELKANLKLKRERIIELEKKRDGIYEFLKNLDLIDHKLYEEKRFSLANILMEKKETLATIKSKQINDKSVGLELEKRILNQREEIVKIEKEHYDKKLFINQLQLLRNQYRSELDKIEFLLEGATVLSKYDFEHCPSCFSELPTVVDKGCQLCGNRLKSLNEVELAITRSEKRKLTIKLNKLALFTDQQKEKVDELERQKENKLQSLNKLESDLNHLRNKFVSPFIEQIETLNLEIGEINSQISELEKMLSIINRFARIEFDVAEEYRLFKQIQDRIKDIEANRKDKDEVISELSDNFNDILESFSFPKLRDAYISEKNYLPYVRGKKYDQIGSLGAVTMITMAYFLSILTYGISENNNHPGLLIVDTPRKNLGARKEDEVEFKDEAIFNSIISYFISLDTSLGNQLQVILVNNGYPEFLDKKYIVKEFDGNGTKGLPYGLIDDIDN